MREDKTSRDQASGTIMRARTNRGQYKGRYQVNNNKLLKKDQGSGDLGGKKGGGRDGG